MLHERRQRRHTNRQSTVGGPPFTLEWSCSLRRLALGTLSRRRLWTLHPQATSHRKGRPESRVGRSVGHKGLLCDPGLHLLGPVEPLPFSGSFLGDIGTKTLTSKQCPFLVLPFVSRHFVPTQETPGLNLIRSVQSGSLPLEGRSKTWS